MAGFSSDKLQATIFALLIADSALEAKLGGAGQIHDDPPEAAPFPYVSFGLTTAIDWDTKSDNGQSHAFEIKIWSQAGGQMESKEIMAIIYNLLHNVSLTVAGAAYAESFCEFTQVLKQTDTSTSTVYYQGTMRFRIRTHS